MVLNGDCKGLKRKTLCHFERSVSCFCNSILIWGESLPHHLPAGYVFFWDILEQPEAHISSQLPLGLRTCPEDPPGSPHLCEEGMSSPMPPRVLCEPTRTLRVCQADGLLLRSCGNELLHVHGRSERGSRSTVSGVYCLASHLSLLHWRFLGSSPLVTDALSWPCQADLSPEDTLGRIWCHHCYLIFTKGTEHTWHHPDRQCSQPLLLPSLPRRIWPWGT